MPELEYFKLLGVSLAIGLLIGLERGWHSRSKAEGMRIAGLRTYGLIGLLGGIAALLAEDSRPLLLGFMFLALTMVLLVAYSRNLDKFEDVGITSMIAALIVFTLGALTVYGHIVLASAIAVVITTILGFKPLLHGWLDKLEQQELTATLKLLLISVVLLPILPDQGYGPWKLLNPYHIWWLVVLIAGVSYLGYFAVRILGDRHGPVLTGMFGGLVSSTAVALHLSRLSAQRSDLVNTLAAGILTACATMFIRTLFLVSLLNPLLFQRLMPALSAMGLLTYLAAIILWRFTETPRNHQQIELENPFQIVTALKFAAFLTLIMLLSKLIQLYFGDMGTYFLAAASGIADVDPITLSMSKMSVNGISIQVAAYAILIAAAVNTAVKAAISWFLGGLGLGLRVSASLAAAIIAGVAIVG